MRHALTHYVKKHLIAIAIILLSFVGASACIYCYTISVNKAIAATQAATMARSKAVEVLIAQIKADKAAAVANTKTTANTATSKPEVVQTPATPSSSCNASTLHNNPASIDVLVNKKHCLIPLSFAPQDLVTIDGATLSAKAADSFDRMYQAAAADGEPFGVSSSYRSYATQVATYNYWVSVSGQAGADTYSARPGYSEHQTGLAVDIEAGGKALSDFLVTTQYTWLQAHAAEYGFIQRYPEGQQAITGYETEEWHYRYVGVAVAQDMKARNIPTLEQYWGISGGDY